MEKIKELALSEFIRKCIDNGELEQKMEQIQQKDAELEVPENELQVLVDQVVKSSTKADVVVKMAKKNNLQLKYWNFTELQSMVTFHCLS